jgi:hypothetical protein
MQSTKLSGVTDVFVFVVVDVGCRRRRLESREDANETKIDNNPHDEMHEMHDMIYVVQ